MANACGMQAMDYDPVWNRLCPRTVLSNKREMDFKVLRIEMLRQGSHDALSAATTQMGNCQQ